MKALKYSLLFTLFLCLGITTQAQDYTWVFFKDKGISENPDYIGQAVESSYLTRLQAAGHKVIGASKWLNAACINGTLNAHDFPFVSRTQPLGKYKVTEEVYQIDTAAYGASDRQLDILNLRKFHQQGYIGTGVKVALFDGGFTKVDSLPAFDSLWKNGQIVNWFDFHDGDSSVFEDSDHGMFVLSLIGGQYPDSLVGAAYGADYYLARTEVTQFERHLEEFNWVKAMEWADSNDVDIIHSSLGYSLFDSLQGDYTYQDMDGKTTIITIAAEIAAQRGIFITNSAGNSGNDPWFHITAPCDGEHVLCVGAVDSFRNKPQFSSFGPSADGRVKPDIMAMGKNTTIQGLDGNIRIGSGTSFSGPIGAGMVACLMQAHPDIDNETLFQAIIQSADRYSNPDSAYGHGIPDVLVADSLIKNTKVNITSLEVSPEVQLYPNPFQTELHLVSNSTIIAGWIMDSQGKQVGKINKVDGNQITIPTSHWAPGLYFVQLQTQAGRVTSKVICSKR